MSTDVIIAIVTGLFGGSGVTALFGFLQSRYRDKRLVASRKADSDARVKEIEAQRESAEAERPIQHFNILVGHFSKRVETLEGSLKECREHHIKCATEVGELRGRIAGLSEIVEKWFEKLIQTASNSGVNITVQEPEKLRSIITETDSAI